MHNICTRSLLALALGISVSSGIVHGSFRTNILQPYNIILWAERYYPSRWSFDISYQLGLHSRGFSDISRSRAWDPQVLIGAADPTAPGLREMGHAGSSLQLFQPDQDVIGCLLQAPPQSPLDLLANLYHRNVNNGQAEVYRPTGNVKVPLNMPFALHIPLVHHVWLDAYWNYLIMELADVGWCNIAMKSGFESLVNPSLLAQVASTIDLSLSGWRTQGFGDGSIQIRWQHDFVQERPFLRNVRLSVRTGLVIPTGSHTNVHRLLGLPLGNDLGVGILGAGFFVLEFPDRWSLLLDLEFTQFLGNTQMRRVATSALQPDLLLPLVTKVYVDPGFTQQYTFMGMKRFWNNGLMVSAAYQYYKHNDDMYYPCDYQLDPTPMKLVESVQEWTTHQFIFQARYGWREQETDGFKPEIGVFGIYGSNGKRAIVLSSIGASVSFGF